MDKQKKLVRGLKMHKAINDKSENFVILEVLNEIQDLVEAIKPVNLDDVKGELKKIKDELSKDLICEIEIV